MRSLAKPNINYEEHFKNCIRRKSEPLRTNLGECFLILSNASDSYDEHASDTSLCDMRWVDPSDFLPVVTDDLEVLYKNQMVKNPSPGRAVYDKILVSAKGKCPLCAYGIPTTLDHFLPKTRYPEFSILPINLLPCCKDCNHAKGEYFTAEENQQYLHPYYEDYSSKKWLEARLTYSIDNAPAFTFFVNPESDDLDEPLLSRLIFQFESLNLQERYAIRAHDELSGTQHQFRELYESGGSALVSSHLASLARSWSASNINSCEAAMYRALSTNQKFCDMDWNL